MPGSPRSPTPRAQPACRHCCTRRPPARPASATSRSPIKRPIRKAASARRPRHRRGLQHRLGRTRPRRPSRTRYDCRSACPAPLDVKANDIDDDGDPLTISYDEQRPRRRREGRRPAARASPCNRAPQNCSVIHYNLTDGSLGSGAGQGAGAATRRHRAEPSACRQRRRRTRGDRQLGEDRGHRQRRRPRTRPDSAVVGRARLRRRQRRQRRRQLGSLQAEPPRHHRAHAGDVQYTISDGHGNEATGNVTVTVLVEALPARPRSLPTTSATRSRTSRSRSTCSPTTAIPPEAEGPASSPTRSAAAAATR